MTVLVSDSFNRANSTTTLGTTDSYNGGTAKNWTAYSGTFGISSNQAYVITSTNNVGYATVDAGVSDAKYTISLPVSANGTRIIFRANSTSFLTFAATSGTYQLYSYNNGTWTQLLDSGKPPANNDLMVISCQGTAITITLNGVQIVNTTSTFNQTSTQFGIGATNGPGNMATLRWDNLQIEDFNTGQTTTYVGGGSITSSASLTSASRVILSDGKAFNGNSSLTGAEIFSYAASGSLSGQSNLSSNDDMFFRASGTLQSVSNLGSADVFIGASGTRYSGMGNILSLSSLSSGEIEKYSGLGSIFSVASLTENAVMVIKEKGDIQAVSILENTLVNTIFNAHGDINTVSFLSSGDLLNGMKNPQQYQDDGIILMHTGLLSHEELIHFAFPVYHGEEIHINGIRKVNVYLMVEQMNQVSFNGRQVTTIYLKGVRK